MAPALFLACLLALPPAQAIQLLPDDDTPPADDPGESGPGLGLLPSVPWPGWCILVYTPPQPPGVYLNLDNCVWYVEWHLADWSEVVECYTSGPNPTMCQDRIDIYPRMLYLLGCYWPEDFYFCLFAPADE